MTVVLRRSGRVVLAALLSGLLVISTGPVPIDEPLPEP